MKNAKRMFVVGLVLAFVAVFVNVPAASASPDIFGNTGTGHDLISINNSIGGSRFYCLGGTATSITAHFYLDIGQGAEEPVKCAIYRDNDNIKVAESEERIFVDVDAGDVWQTFTISASLPAGYYWLLVFSDTEGQEHAAYLYCEQGAGGGMILGRAYSSGYPSSISGYTYYAELACSIYCTYTPYPTLPSKPVLLSPDNNYSASDNKPTFKWTRGSGADNHRIEVDNEYPFSGALIDNVVVASPTDNTWIKTGAGYAVGTYYWRVVARNAQGENVSVNTWKFTIKNFSIFIDGDSQFDVAHGVNGGGDGTVGNPYVIENWAISALNATGIRIQNTTAYFVVRKCLVENGGGNYHGIYLKNAVHGKIDNNTCNNNKVGIYLEISSYDNLTNNTCEKNVYGIRLYYLCNYDNLTNNVCENNGYRGIELYISSYCIVENNVCCNNGTASGGYGIYFYHSNYENIRYNITGNNSAGIGLEGPDNYCILVGNINENEGEGIILFNSNYCLLENNNCSNNTYAGIEVASSSYDNIFYNTCDNVQGGSISGETYAGIMLGYTYGGSTPSHNNLVIGNHCENDNWGITTYYSSGSAYSNTFYLNTILNCLENNAYDDNINAWDNGSAGNYWSDWQIPDANNNGVVDVPRTILGGTNQDNYPLVIGWTYSPPSVVPTLPRIIMGMETASASNGGSPAMATLKVFGTLYTKAENGQIWCQLLDNTGTPVNTATVKLNCYYENLSKHLDNVTMTYVTGSLGVYTYDFLAPSVYGVYLCTVWASWNGNNAYGSGEFQVSSTWENINNTYYYLQTTILPAIIQARDNAVLARDNAYNTYNYLVNTILPMVTQARDNSVLARDNAYNTYVYLTGTLKTELDNAYNNAIYLRSQADNIKAEADNLQAGMNVSISGITSTYDSTVSILNDTQDIIDNCNTIYDYLVDTIYPYLVTMKGVSDNVQIGMNLMRVVVDNMQIGLNALRVVADNSQTGINGLSTKCDNMQTGINNIKTTSDNIQTGLNALWVVADNLQAGVNIIITNLTTTYNLLVNVEDNALYIRSQADNAKTAIDNAQLGINLTLAEAISIYNDTTTIISNCNTVIMKCDVAENYLENVIYDYMVNTLHVGMENAWGVLSTLSVGSNASIAIMTVPSPWTKDTENSQIYCQIENAGIPLTDETVYFCLWARDNTAIVENEIMAHLARGIYQYQMVSPTQEGHYAVDIRTDSGIYGSGVLSVIDPPAGPQGEQGLQGPMGENGQTPSLQYDSGNNRIRWYYENGYYTDWIDLPPGPQGPQGIPGTPGENGTGYVGVVIRKNDGENLGPFYGRLNLIEGVDMLINVENVPADNEYRITFTSTASGGSAGLVVRKNDGENLGPYYGRINLVEGDNILITVENIPENDEYRLTITSTGVNSGGGIQIGTGGDELALALPIIFGVFGGICGAIIIRRRPTEDEFGLRYVGGQKVEREQREATPQD